MSRTLYAVVDQTDTALLYSDKRIPAEVFPHPDNILEAGFLLSEQGRLYTKSWVTHYQMSKVQCDGRLVEAPRVCVLQVLEGGKK